MIIFFSLRVLFFSSLSCDRSFTPTHPSYYSPKHESMMEEMLSCQQVKHGTQHTNQSGGSCPSFFSFLFFVCVLTHWKFSVMTWTETTTTYFATPLRLRPFQVSSLSRENERDSYRLSWGTENLDNVALSSSPIHSGYVYSSWYWLYTARHCNEWTRIKMQPIFSR